MADTTADKSYDPTPHRRQEARKQGQVASSQDLGSAAMLIIGILALMAFGGSLLQMIAGMIQRALSEAAWRGVDAAMLVSQWNGIAVDLAVYLLPILGVLMLGGIAASLLQVGFLFVPERVAPDISRIDPLKGWQRVFSLTGAMRLVFGLFKVVVIVAVAWLSLRSHWWEILGSGQLAVPQVAWYMVETTLAVCLKVALALLALAVLDYAYQRWKHEQDLRMTHQEIRDELRNYQGDPQVLARRRTVQRQLVMQRLADSVPGADVVVTNPTHLAVAIGYKPNEMAAPVVVAKGAGVLAQRIRRLALEHDIPIVEKKPLAQAIYKEVDINQAIPDKMYAAVAEVLAYVYQLKGKDLPGPAAAA